MVLHVGVTVTVRFRTCSDVITTSIGLALIDKELRPIIGLDLQSPCSCFLLTNYAWNRPIY